MSPSRRKKFFPSHPLQSRLSSNVFSPQKAFLSNCSADFFRCALSNPFQKFSIRAGRQASRQSPIYFPYSGISICESAGAGHRWLLTRLQIELVRTVPSWDFPRLSQTLSPRQPLSSGGSQSLRRFEDQLLCSLPIDATVGNGYSISQPPFWTRKWLIAGLQIALQHCPDNRPGPLNSLLENRPKDLWLTPIVLPAIAMATIDYDRLRNPSCF